MAPQSDKEQLMNKTFRILLAVFSLFISMSCGGALAEDQVDPYAMVHVGDMCPAFTGVTTDNTTISLQTLKGKIIVLTFFTTY